MKSRQKLEEDRRALIAFVTRFDSSALSSTPAIPARLRQPMLPSSSLGPMASRRHTSHGHSSNLTTVIERTSPMRRSSRKQSPNPSPVKAHLVRSVREAPSLLDTSDSDFSELPEMEGPGDTSFERALLVDHSENSDLNLKFRGDVIAVDGRSPTKNSKKSLGSGAVGVGSPRSPLRDKENISP